MSGIQTLTWDEKTELVKLGQNEECLSEFHDSNYI